MGVFEDVSLRSVWARRVGISYMPSEVLSTVGPGYLGDWRQVAIFGVFDGSQIGINSSIIGGFGRMGRGRARSSSLPEKVFAYFVIGELYFRKKFSSVW